MGDIKEKYNRYGVSEWVTLALGVILFGIQAYRYTTDSLGDPGTETVVLAVAILLITSPLTLANIIRKARGIDTK